MASNRHWEQDKESTVYVGNLDERVTDAIVWQWMTQAGPVHNVHLPKDRVTQNHQGYGFVEFGTEEDADYAVKVMNQVRMYGKPVRVNKASADKRPGGAAGATEGGQSNGIGADLFIGSLDASVNEKILYDTFSRFGALAAAPKLVYDEHNISKCFAFVSYTSFEAADDAVQNMHGQYLNNKEVVVQYAFKKDGKGERHGDAAERQLAAQAKLNNVEMPAAPMPAGLVNTPMNAPTGPNVGGGQYRPQAQQGYGQPPTPAASPYGGYGAYPPPQGGFPPMPMAQPPQQAYGAYPQSPAAPYNPYAANQFPPQQSPGFAGAPQGFAGPPQGFAGPPQGFAGPPNGFAGPSSAAHNRFIPPGPPRAFQPSTLPAPPAAGLPPRPPPGMPGNYPPR